MSDQSTAATQASSTTVRTVETFLNALQERDEQFAIETMCVAGGQGMALLLENPGV